ncbi:MAG: DUF1289 domain-containing protein [Paracoccaceae bacterium]
MSDDIWKRDEIESPCIKVCVLHPEEGLCTGCLRTREEIARWSRMTSEERRAIMAALPSRAPRLRKRRGGRAARLTR